MKLCVCQWAQCCWLSDYTSHNAPGVNCDTPCRCGRVWQLLRNGALKSEEWPEPEQNPSTGTVTWPSCTDLRANPHVLTDKYLKKNKHLSAWSKQLIRWTWCHVVSRPKTRQHERSHSAAILCYHNVNQKSVLIKNVLHINDVVQVWHVTLKKKDEFSLKIWEI